MKLLTIFALLVCNTAFADYDKPTPPPAVPEPIFVLYWPGQDPTDECVPIAPLSSGDPRPIGKVMRKVIDWAFDDGQLPQLMDSSGVGGKFAPHLDAGNNGAVFFGYGAEATRRQGYAHEQQIYVDPLYKGNGKVSLGLSPFSVENGILSITAERTPESLYRPLMGYQYTSGLLSTHGMFAMQRGYAEISARVPAATALLPAFWALRYTPRGWPPEIDIMEAPAHEPGVIPQTIHYVGPYKNESKSCRLARPGFDGQFHTYGAYWDENRVVFYFDRQVVGQVKSQAGMNAPFYLMVNLAVGGDWQGFSGPSTTFPQKMEIDYISAWTVTGPKGCTKDSLGVLVCK